MVAVLMKAKKKVWFMVFGKMEAGRETLSVCRVKSCLGWKVNANVKPSRE